MTNKIMNITSPYVIDFFTKTAQKITNKTVELLNSVGINVSYSWGRLFNFLVIAVFIFLSIKFIAKPALKIIIITLLILLAIGLVIPLW